MFLSTLQHSTLIFNYSTLSTLCNIKQTLELKFQSLTPFPSFQILFLLVGYDELVEEESGDLNDLLDGQMFPSSTVLTTSRPGCPRPLPPALHRRLLVAGLSHDQTHRFFTHYFQSIGKPGSGNEVRERERLPHTCTFKSQILIDCNGLNS